MINVWLFGVGETLKWWFQHGLSQTHPITFNLTLNYKKDQGIKQNQTDIFQHTRNCFHMFFLNIILCIVLENVVADHVSLQCLIDAAAEI